MNDPSLRDLLARVVNGDASAAPGLRQLAARLVALADQLEAGGSRDPGAMADRVRMQVVGPNGEARQHIDTGEAS